MNPTLSGNSLVQAAMGQRMAPPTGPVPPQAPMIPPAMPPAMPQGMPPAPMGQPMGGAPMAPKLPGGDTENIIIQALTKKLDRMSKPAPALGLPNTTA